MKLLIVGGTDADVRIARTGLGRGWRIESVHADELSGSDADVVYTPSVIPAGVAFATAQGHEAPATTRWLSGVSSFDLMADYQRPETTQAVTSTLALVDGIVPRSKAVAEALKARRLRARILAVAPPVGVEPEGMGSGRSPASRRVIAVHGGHGLLERGQVAIAALRMAAKDVAGHDIVVMHAEPDAALVAELLAADTGLGVATLNPEQSDHAAVWNAHGQAVLSIHLSLDPDVSAWDGAALAHGCVPIISAQSTLATEWARDASFVAVDPEDPNEIAAAIRRTIRDQTLNARATSSIAGLARSKLGLEAVAGEFAAAIAALIKPARR